LAFAQGSRTNLSYIVETTYGVTPAGNFTPLLFNTHTLNLAKEVVEGNEIRADRMPRVERHGNKSTAGDITVDLRKGNYDDLIESVMLNSFASDNTITVGTTINSLSIEDHAADIDQARLFTGMAASTMNVSIAPNQMVLTTFGFVGKDMTIGTTEKTLNAATSNQPFDSYSGDIFLNDSGATDVEVNNITSVEFTIDNSLAQTFVVGSDSTPCLEYGRAVVTGTVTAYFEDANYINRFINETESELTVSVDDPTAASTYTFYFPKIKVNGADVSMDSPTSRLVTIPFSALYESNAASNLVITRTV